MVRESQQDFLRYESLGLVEWILMSIYPSEFTFGTAKFSQRG